MPGVNREGKSRSHKHAVIVTRVWAVPVVWGSNHLRPQVKVGPLRVGSFGMSSPSHWTCSRC